MGERWYSPIAGEKSLETAGVFARRAGAENHRATMRFNGRFIVRLTSEPRLFRARRAAENWISKEPRIAAARPLAHKNFSLAGGLGGFGTDVIQLGVQVGSIFC